MKRRNHHKRAARLDLIAGVVLGLLGLIALAALGGGLWWLKSKRIDIVESTLCPKSGPRAVHALLIDRTDPVTGQQGLEIKQHIDRLTKDPRTGQRFDFYTVEGDTQKVLEPVLEICSPGQGKDANEIYENPGKIQKRFETRFAEVLTRTVSDLLKESTKPSSPIIESIRAASISSFGPFGDSEIPVELTIISDMVQHSALNSHFRNVPNFKELSRTQSWRSLQPDLRGANVVVLYLLRPTAVRSGVPIQNRGHQLFWEELISGSNGRLVSFQPI
jgi:hypothetical protein